VTAGEIKLKKKSRNRNAKRGRNGSRQPTGKRSQRSPKKPKGNGGSMNAEHATTYLEAILQLALLIAAHAGFLLWYTKQIGGK
jgi:hypothetical protein